MKKISPTIILLGTIIAGALALCALYLYFFSSLSKMGEEQRNAVGEIKNADSIIRIETEHHEKLEAYFLKEGEQADYVSDIEALCVQLSLECSQTLNETDDAGGAVKHLGVAIKARGTFEGIFALLHHFESSRYPVFFSKFGLSSSEAGWDGVLEFTLPVIITQ